MGKNAHPLHLPKELNMSSIFDIAHIYDYNQDENMDCADNILKH